MFFFLKVICILCNYFEHTNNGDFMSIWTLNEKKRKTNILNKDIFVDTLIVGGGITGMTTAYFLRNNDVCLVDANRIGHGVTMNSTAKINYFQERIYTDIVSSSNYDNAVKYLHSQKEAINLIKNIIENENILCDFEQVPSYVFANSKEEVSKLDDEISFLIENGCDVKEKSPPIDCDSYKSYCVNDTYIFNPIKYLNGLYEILKDKISIYEDTVIRKIEKVNDNYVCYSKNNKIVCNKVILACHYPFFLVPMMMPFRCSLEKSYIVISKVKKDKKFTCISSNNPTFSCRYYNDGENIYQISLSKSHDLSHSYNDEYYFDRVKDIFKLSDKDIILKYSNIDIMTPDHMPYIGKLDDNLYIGVGYNTWGMTNGVLAAKIVSDLVLGVDNLYVNVFNPKRIGMQNIIKLPVYIFNNTKSFIGTKVNKNRKWYSNKVKFIKRDGVSLGVYTDEDGEHIVYNKCPHLGCSLIFNEVEKTWDCPCHSSRFDLDGHCIKGPSTYDISYKE